MNRYKFFTYVVVSILVAILTASVIASALNHFPRVTDTALADNTTIQRTNESTLNAPNIATRNYLPIIFLN